MSLLMLVVDCLLWQKSGTLIGQLGYKETDACKKVAQCGRLPGGVTVGNSTVTRGTLG